MVKHEATLCRALLTLLIVVLSSFSSTSEAVAQLGPQPGDVYREYSLHNGGNIDWRVTNPKVAHEDAQKFLPNPILNLQVTDLDHAVRAEALIDRWGGHPRTTQKQIRFNKHKWLRVPELLTTPPGNAPETFMFQDNPIVEVPLNHLREGANTIEGTCGAFGETGWGQWGLYSVILRVYYDPLKKTHTTGTLASPLSHATLPENPVIEVAVSDEASVGRVDVVALHRNYDVNGDGVYREWVRSYHQPRRGEPADIRNHVGTRREPPFEVTWDTSWVPDQEPGSVQLIARIQNTDGVWFVTDRVEGLSLGDRPYTAHLYPAADVPPKFSSRLGKPMSCRIVIPDNHDLSKAVGAVIHLRTWEGEDKAHKSFTLNDWPHANEGLNHHYDYDVYEVPVEVLKNGGNTFTICSDTKHHALEVLWPGPALTVRYKKAAPSF